MEWKRITLLSGHYGSGKTNIAVNLALEMRKTHEKVTVADIDIVNPYFRTADSRQELEAAGIRLISSEYASSNVDLPALPQQVYSITDDRTWRAIIDVGGDDRGALALGRWRDAILAENDYEMVFVTNFYRPLTRDVASAMEVMEEIELAAGMRFTSLANNSNLGAETTAEDVLVTAERMRALSMATGLPVRMTTVHETLYEALFGRMENVYPLRLQKKIQ